MAKRDLFDRLADYSWVGPASLAFAAVITVARIAWILFNEK